MNLTTEQIQERRQLAAFIFSKENKKILDGEKQLVELVGNLLRFGDLEANEFECVLQDVALNLINPDFSVNLSKHSQQHAAKVFYQLLYFFRYVESECEHYLNYEALQNCCASVPQDIYDDIKSRYTA